MSFTVCGHCQIYSKNLAFGKPSAIQRALFPIFLSCTSEINGPWVPKKLRGLAIRYPVIVGEQKLVLPRQFQDNNRYV